MKIYKLCKIFKFMKKQCMKKYIFVFNLLFLLISAKTITYDLLVVKDPIVDLCSHSSIPYQLPIDEHSSRIHQGLFNELAHYIEEKDGYVKISFDNIQDTIDDSPTYFWSKKTNLIPMQNLTNHKLRETIPHPIYGQTPTIVLTYPWKRFSIGTRFKHVPERDSKTSFCVIRADYKKNKAVFLRIPRENGMLEIKQTKKSSRALFVTLVNNLVSRINHNNPGYAIPYVWGGNSFLKPYKTNDFYKKNDIWQRNGRRDPYTGYDSSGFVMQMAQMAGINFPWKTSKAINFYQPHLTKAICWRMAI
jgi:hypothetical protein